MRRTWDTVMRSDGVGRLGRIVVVRAIVASLVCAWGTAFAQTTTAPSAGDETTLAERQALIGDRVKRLEDRMFQLAQALKKTDPDKASRLVEGLGALREQGLEDRIVAVVRLLREHQLVDAVDAQVNVESQLQSILKLLMEETNDLEKQREEAKRLEEVRKQLDELLNKQRAAKERAERAEAMTRLAESLDDAANLARGLLERQEGLSADRGQGGPEGGRPAEAQAAIRGETEALARDVDDIAEALDAAKATESKSNAGSPGTEGEETPKSDGASDSPENGENATGTPAENSGLSEKAKAAGGHLGGAADAMKKAEDALRNSDGDDSVKPSQDQAAESLKKAIEELDAEAKAVRNRLKLDDEADVQRKLAEESEKALQAMRGGEENSEGADASKSSEAKRGDKQEGEQGGESEQGSQSPSGSSNQGSSGSQPQGSPPAPGEKPLEEAIPHQQDAAKDLEDHLPSEAVEDQQKAIEKLEEAREDVEERLDQLRREQQEQLLSALESRFRAMLSRQLEVNKATDRLIDLGAAQWKRSDQLELADLSEKQRWVGDEADEAMFLLKEEGSTVVLPPLLENVRDDARHVADQLASARADLGVRTLQGELEAVLRDMIDAVRKQQEELQQGGGGGGGGDGSPPLLPGSAELKLLRSCQLRINGATEALHKASADSSSNEDGASGAIQRLAEKQRNVAEMARSMHESLQKAQ